MSIASISYNRLEGAANDAKRVAKRLNNYADAIEKRVYKKLNSYSGGWSSNLSTASSKANSKIDVLRDKADKFERYSADLLALKDECVATDKSVKSKIQSLTASFKDKHGIKDNAVVNAISYFFTSVKNETGLGRWLGDKFEWVSNGITYIKDSINAWWNLGGKDVVKGLAVALLEFAIGCLAVAGAILSGGAIIFVIAGVVAGLITAVNGFVNFVNELRKSSNLYKDPLFAKRLGNSNTLQDVMRNEWGMHGAAKAMDIVSTAASVVSLFSSGANILKKGYKWATGNPHSKKAAMDILFKGGLSDIGRKIKTSVGDFIFNVNKAVNTRNWTYVKDIASEVGSDFLKNMNGRYLDFSTKKDAVNSTKNILSATKDAINITDYKSFFKGLGNNVIFPGITVVDVPVPPGAKYDAIRVSDFKNFISNSVKSFKEIKSYFSSGSGNDVYSKLSGKSNINISIPNTYFPEPNLMVAGYRS